MTLQIKLKFFFTLWFHSAGAHYNILFTQKALEELLPSWKHCFLSHYSQVTSTWKSSKSYWVPALLSYTCDLKIAVVTLVGNIALNTKID